MQAKPLEIKLFMRRDDEFGNVTMTYGNVVWSRETKGEADLAAAVKFMEHFGGSCLWIDGKPVVYTR